MKIINEGAEARIFSADLFGNSVIVKERQRKAYRIEQIDNELRTARTKREAKVLHEVSRLGVNAPRLLAIGKFSIYMSRVNGKLLKDSKSGSRLFLEIGRQLALIHNGNVAHGDFTPANIMLSDGKPFVIDFGLSEMTSSIEEKAIDLLLMKRSIDMEQYKAFIKSYAKHSKNSREMIARLASIERRGRYQTRTLA